jgi:negative regulator of flagellin synthesis FlgM
MTNDIKGLGSPPSTDPSALRSTGKDNGTAANQAAATPAPAPTGVAKAAAESVSLSSNAQALKAVEEKIQKLPDINEKKVAEIKAALDSGQYTVDDLVIADKLLGFDDLFN